MTNLALCSDLMGQYVNEADGATSVSYENFQRYVSKASRNIAKAFETLDPDNSGYLTESGLLVALRSLGFSAQQEDALKMIQLLDRNKDRKITYQEFVRFACLLPETQLANDNVAFCWVDSADYVDGMECRLNMVCPIFERVVVS